MSKSVLPIFSSRSFILPGLKFSSLIHLNLFLCMFLENILFHSLSCSYSVFPAPHTEGTVFLPSYTLASFVIDELMIGAWVYFRAFCSVPLITVSVFVPVSYCFDDCSFVVSPEVREPDCTCSVFLSQDCFGSPGSFVFPYTL